MDIHSTICALSTPPGVGAIALIRVSGKDALHFVQPIFSKDITSSKGYTVHFGKIISQNETIDEVILTVFRIFYNLKILCVDSTPFSSIN